MMRVEERGAAIELELWSLDAQRFGRFVARVPPPLCIGTIELDDGTPRQRLPVRTARADGRHGHLPLRRLAAVSPLAELSRSSREARECALDLLSKLDHRSIKLREVSHSPQPRSGAAQRRACMARSRRPDGGGRLSNSIIAQSSCLSFRATSTRSGRRPDHATSPTQAASPAHPRDLGGKRAGAGRKPSGSRPAPPHRPRAPHDVRQPLHATLRALSACLHYGAEAIWPAVRDAVRRSNRASVPGRSFLGAVRSSSPDRRGRLACRAQARTVGTGGPDREGESTGALAGRVGSGPTATTCARSAAPREVAPRDDVCAAEFLQAPAGAAGRRSAQLGAVVRWVEGAAATRRRTRARSLLPRTWLRGRGMATCRRRIAFAEAPDAQLD